MNANLSKDSPDGGVPKCGDASISRHTALAIQKRKKKKKCIMDCCEIEIMPHYITLHSIVYCIIIIIETSFHCIFEVFFLRGEEEEEESHSSLFMICQCTVIPLLCTPLISILLA